MILAPAQDAKFSSEESNRRLNLQHLEQWYELYRQLAPEKHTDLDLTVEDMPKEEGEEEE